MSIKEAAVQAGLLQVPVLPAYLIDLPRNAKQSLFRSRRMACRDLSLLHAPVSVAVVVLPVAGCSTAPTAGWFTTSFNMPLFICSRPHFRVGTRGTQNDAHSKTARAKMVGAI